MRRVYCGVACFALLIATSGHLLAQRNSWRVTTPSPTGASLGKFGDFPVSLYSGTPDITIPLFTARGRTLELPIALKYHAGGIKVEEIGSWVGIGWTLEAGGAITRTVRGLRDEDIGRGYFYTGTTWYQGNNWSAPDANLLQNLRDEQVDGEPDQFFFSFAGRSGQFVMGPINSGGTIEYRAIPHQKLRIEPLIASGEIIEWTITTEDGTVYVFGFPEPTTDWTSTSSTAESSHFGETYTSTWHLTSIRAPGGDEITLSYVTYTVRHKLGRSTEKFDDRQGITECWPPQGIFNVFPENAIATARLESIHTAAHVIAFTPGPDARTDDQPVSGTSPRLDQITVFTPTGSPLRVFQFVQDYSTGRLTLKSVAEQTPAPNVTSLPPYTFSYDSRTLPNRFSFAMDHWGFYNGRHSNDNLSSNVPVITAPSGSTLAGAIRTPDSAYARAGILRRITYPTGGFTDFEYELNDYGAVGATPANLVGDGPAQLAEAFAGSDAEVVETEFTVSSPIPGDEILVTVTFSQSPNDCAGLDEPPCPMTELVGKAGFQYDGSRQFLLTPGVYRVRATTLVPGQLAQIEAVWSNRVVAVGKLGGGMRIKEIRSSDGMNPQTITIRRYTYTLASEPTRSSGVVSNEPKYHYSFIAPTCSYFSRSSMSKSPLGDGPVVSYREVTVWHGANGEFGKTRHRFRSAADVQDVLTFSNGWPFARRTSYEYMRGQELESIESDASDRKQQRIASTHAFPTDPSSFREFLGMSSNSFSLGPGGSSAYAYQPFKVLSGWAYQDSDTTVSYDEAGVNSISTARTYAYENPAHLQLTHVSETNSDGTKRITRMKYPADYAIGAPPAGSEADALRLMQSTAHIHNAVVERWVVELTGGNARIVQAELTTFKEFGPDKILPYQHFILNAPSPLP